MGQEGQEKRCRLVCVSQPVTSEPHLYYCEDDTSTGFFLVDQNYLIGRITCASWGLVDLLLAQGFLGFVRKSWMNYFVRIRFVFGFARGIHFGLCG